MLESIIVNGLVTGGMYALLAVGFALVFGVARIINMGHTAFYMAAAFLIYIFTSMLGLPILVSAAIAMVVVTLLALGYFKSAIERVKQHELAVMLITMAFAILLQEILLVLFSGDYRSIKPFFEGYTEIFGVRVTYQQLFSIGTSIACLVALLLILTRTRIGIAIRAVSQDAEMTNALGINDGFICFVTMGISAFLAALAAVIIAPINLVYPYMWSPPLVVILAAVVLGGLGSITGSIVGAFILGFVEVILVTLVPGGGFLRGVASLVAMIIVLIIKPEGLFGVVFEEERL
ncbi:MAG: branched-chain amino acid ABC transporter permease [Syntrophales bacterium LBB04]|nr:branched-chain amino acid ABC transporter permease [Syntrophales bacterium LBB04]